MREDRLEKRLAAIEAHAKRTRDHLASIRGILTFFCLLVLLGIFLALAR